MVIEKRQRPDYFKEGKEVVDLEDTNSGVIISLPLYQYRKMSLGDGKTDESIFHEISLFHDQCDRDFGPDGASPCRK